MASSVDAFCAQTLAFLALPFLLLETYGRSALQAGLLLTAWPLAIVTVAPVSGWLIGRYSDGLLGGLGMAVFAAGLWLLALLPAQPSDLDVIWRLALCGAGFALFQSPNNHTIVRSTPVQRSGAGSAMLGTARLTGQTLGAIILATLFAVWPDHGGTAEMVALAGAGIFALVAGVCSSLRVRQPRP
ncbi:Major Facilitator Superfamily protein [compost metagenome]